MKKATGINDLLEMNFDEYKFDGEWEAAFGRPEIGFSMLIYGPEKNGKTDLSLKLSKYVSKWGKVYLNNHEEGKSKTMQQAFIRNNMKEVAGKVMLLHKEPFEVIFERLKKKGGPKFLVTDSIDYMEFTEKQYKLLVDTFPRLTLIFLSWCDSQDRPKSHAAKMIAKRVDIKALIKNRTVYPDSRFGGNEPFSFGPAMKSLPTTQQLQLL